MFIQSHKRSIAQAQVLDVIALRDDIVLNFEVATDIAVFIFLLNALRKRDKEITVVVRDLRGFPFLDQSCVLCKVYLGAGTDIDPPVFRAAPE
jgi:hypothetical protein